MQAFNTNALLATGHWPLSTEMGKTIAICNQKGGVGKSTTAVNLGAYLALAGKRTLLVDLDPQGNATISCGIARNSSRKTVYDALLHGTQFSELIVLSVVTGLEIAPSSFELATADLALGSEESRERILASALEPHKALYDVILLDCPPSLGTLTINALVAADGALVPVQCEYLALEGLNGLLTTLERVRQTRNPSLTITGILLTMADSRTHLSQEVANEVRGFFKELVFATMIPRNVRLAECPSFGKPICVYDPHSIGATAYQALAQEVLNRLGASQDAAVLSSSPA